MLVKLAGALIKLKNLEGFIFQRLKNIQKRPLMYGSPSDLEAQGFVYLELLATFCWNSSTDIMEEYQSFRRQKFPKCPSPPQLSYWLQDAKYGLGLEEKEAAQKVSDFFVDLAEQLKLKWGITGFD